MVRYCLVVLCLTSTLTLGQAAAPSGQSTGTTAPGQASAQPARPAEQPASAQAAPKPAPAAKAGAEARNDGKQAVAESAVVITIKNLCPPAARRAAAGQAKKPAQCATIITRAELEKVINAVGPNLPPPRRRMMAEQYVQFLVAHNAARRAGLEQDPQVQEQFARIVEQVKLARMQILANAYRAHLAKQFENLPQAEIAKYYKDNSAQFEEVTLKRVWVPKIFPKEGKPADQAPVKVLADKIRQRAAAGEDFEKLQQEAFAALSTEKDQQGPAPPASLGAKRRGSLPPRHESSVFELKVGEVSPVYDESSGFFIYKVVGKSPAPLGQVKDEIKRTLQNRKLLDAMDALKNSVTATYLDAYFSPPAETAPPAATPAAKPQEAPKTAEPKPAEPKPAEPKPAEPKPAEQKPAIAPPSSGESPKTPPPAAPQPK